MAVESENSDIICGNAFALAVAIILSFVISIVAMYVDNRSAEEKEIEIRLEKLERAFEKQSKLDREGYHVRDIHRGSP